MAVLSNLKIGVKLFLGFGFLMAATVFIVVIAIGSQRNLRDEASYVLEGPFARYALGRAIERDIQTANRIRADFGVMANVPDPATRTLIINNDVTRLGELVREVDQKILAYRHSMDTVNVAAPATVARHHALMDEIADLWSQYIERVYQKIPYALDGNPMQVLILSSGSNEILEAIDPPLQYLLNVSTLYMANSPELMTSIANAGRLVLVAVVIVAMIISVVVAYITTKSITGPVNNLSSLVADVADGKVNVNINRVNISKDEVGALTQDVCNLVDIVRGMVDDLDVMYKEYITLGNIHYKIDDSKYKNSFKDMMKLINKLNAQMVVDIQEIASVMSHINSGDFSKDMDANIWVGEWVAIPNVVNGLIANINDINKEVNAMIDAVASRGDLNFKIDEGNYNGGWRKIMEGLNSISASVSGPIEATKVVLGEMSKGNFDIETLNKNLLEKGFVVNPQDYHGVFREMVSSMDETLEQVSSYVNELNELLAAMANGDLRNSINREYAGVFNSIKGSVNNITGTLHKNITEISMASQNVLDGATRITSSAMELSSGSSTQAASLEELNTSVEAIKIQTQEFAQNAREANEFSVRSATNAKTGNDAMKKMTDAMGQIKNSSNNISTIIRVIQDIAFQTNLLALNAAVEAARAGEHGRGFAVVAEEVRSLAARSQGAASETTALIQDSITSVESGASIAQITAQSLDAIVESASEVLSLINNITTAANEQSEMMAQISSVLLHTANTVQDNSKFAQEAAATAEELSSQSEMLKQMVAFFKL